MALRFLLALGGALIVVGVGLISLAAAFIVTGVLLIATAIWNFDVAPKVEL